MGLVAVDTPFFHRGDVHINTLAPHLSESPLRGG